MTIRFDGNIILTVNAVAIQKNTSGNVFKFCILNAPTNQRKKEISKNYSKFIFQNNNFPGVSLTLHCTKMKFSIKDFFSKCDQIRRKLEWKTFIICAVLVQQRIGGNVGNVTHVVPAITSATYSCSACNYLNQVCCGNYLLSIY